MSQNFSLSLSPFLIIIIYARIYLMRSAVCFYLLKFFFSFFNIQSPLDVYSFYYYFLSLSLSLIFKVMLNSFIFQIKIYKTISLLFFIHFGSTFDEMKIRVFLLFLFLFFSILREIQVFAHFSLVSLVRMEENDKQVYACVKL